MRISRDRRWLAAAMIWPVTAVACDIDAVTVAEGKSLVVVQAVMRPDLPDQFVIVERSLSGSDSFPLTEPIPPDSPRTPIRGATVLVSNLDFPNDPCGNPVTFLEADSQVTSRTGVYWAPVGCPSMRAGDRLSLLVATLEGDTVRGVTRVPGLTNARLALGGQEVDLGGPSIVLNRDRDTMVVAAQTVASRAIQVEVLRDRMTMPPLSRPGAGLSLRLFVDGETVTLPGDLLHVFERGTGEDVFVGGRRYTLVVAATDSNFFDFVRSENSDETGRGFVNRLTGGVGVFGSLVAATQAITAVADQDDPREGRYRLQGIIQGVDVDVELNLFLARPAVSAEYSAFASGTWFEGSLVSLEPSLDGTFAADTMTGTFQSVLIKPNLLGIIDTSAASRFTFSGIRQQGAPFEITLLNFLQCIVGTLTATQQ